MNPIKDRLPPSPLDIILRTGIFKLFSRQFAGRFCPLAAEVAIRSPSCLISTQYERSHLRPYRAAHF
jgi:hypothetical protein